MFYVVSPEKPKPTVPYADPTFESATETRKRIDAAVAQKQFGFEDPQFVIEMVSGSVILQLYCDPLITGTTVLTR